MALFPVYEREMLDLLTALGFTMQLRDSSLHRARGNEQLDFLYIYRKDGFVVTFCTADNFIESASLWFQGETIDFNYMRTLKATGGYEYQSNRFTGCCDIKGVNLEKVLADVQSCVRVEKKQWRRHTNVFFTLWWYADRSEFPHTKQNELTRMRMGRTPKAFKEFINEVGQ